MDRLESLVRERESWENQATSAAEELARSREQETILRRSIVEGRARELLLEARISTINRNSVSLTTEGQIERDSLDTIRKTRIGTPIRTTGPISPTRQRYSTSYDLTLRHQTPPRIPLSMNPNPTSPSKIATSPYRSRTPLSYTHTRSASAAPILPANQSFSPSNVIRRNGSISSFDEGMMG